MIQKSEFVDMKKSKKTTNNQPTIGAVMSSKNFTLTYDELLLLLKEAYKNGYAIYEIADAGLEPYDADGYARWVLSAVTQWKA